MAEVEKVILDGDDIRRALVRMSHEIVERNAGAHEASGRGSSEKLALVGIHTRGAHLAARLGRLVDDLLESEVPRGDLDIAFYRDDVATHAPVVHATHLDFDVEGRTVVVVDDVLFTGRTVRAAIEALFAFGRPARVQLAVLVDRGHRELPIRPDYVGKNLPTARSERVNVRLEETDGTDVVDLTGAPATVRR